MAKTATINERRNTDTQAASISKLARQGANGISNLLQ
jgi:hypothetical protein